MLKFSVGRWQLKFHEGWIDCKLAHSLRHQIGMAAPMVAQVLFTHNDIAIELPPVV